MFDELVERIEQLLAEKPHVVVAITGFGGSGKSALADRLRDHFKVEDRQTVRLDNIFAAEPHDHGIFDEYDWRVITNILQGASHGERLQYQGRGFKGELLSFDEPLPRVVIIEGGRLFRPEAMPYFDVAVWIDCPQDFATERAKARDRAQGEDEETIARWDTEWNHINLEYFNTYHPDKLATFVYREYK